ncbi:GIY-YIG nuclease family protein [Paracoccus sp. DMF-8]|uniref:GIY-YIG nuclease family protein n=1 Tax=Paracoccus sp. DMF-8 TaxID=3019445 RepID=UPI0023E7F88C|nr:GIY-YIG nuclease family protein [Paracoccus sp. DMF-8]MDF3606307.1 GIY-YIG nuclease family protein [Paracoccus sp. DMF-8]
MSKECTLCDQGKCQPTFVYVVGNRDGTGSVKVGISVSASKRLAQHRKKTRRDLVVHWKKLLSCEFAAFDAEQAICDQLDYCRDQGDWFFRPVGDVVLIAEKACK